MSENNSPENKGIKVETKEGGTAATMKPSRQGVEVNTETKPDQSKKSE